LVTPIETDAGAVAGGRTTGPLNMDTEVQLLKSLPVARQAREHLESDEPAAKLLRGVTVLVPPNTSVMDVSYEVSGPGASPRAAQNGAAAFAQAYLNDRATVARQEISADVKAHEAKISTLQDELADLLKEAAALPSGAADKVVKQAQAQVVTEQIKNVARGLDELQNVQVEPGRVIGIHTPKRPSSPNARVIIGGALSLGFLIGVAVAFVRQRANRTFADLAEVERSLGKRILAAVPEDGTVVRDGERLTALGQARRSFRLIANELTDGAAVEHPTFVVAGVGRESASDYVSANLAATLAGLDLDVLCVQADLEAGDAGDTVSGLSDVLLGHAEAVDAMRPSKAVPGLFWMGPGTTPELAAERIYSDDARRLFGTLSSGWDAVVLTCPPTSTSAVAQSLSRRLGSIVLVVRLGIDDRAETLEAVRACENAGTHVAVVVTLPRRKRRRRRWAAPRRQSPAVTEHKVRSEDLPQVAPGPPASQRRTG